MQRSADNEKQYILAAQAGDGKAENALLDRYKNLVRARARQFFLAGGETEDLVQEGMIGLMQAIRTYRVDTEMSFKNFAYLCITRRILDALRASSAEKSSPLNDSVPLNEFNEREQFTGSVSPEEIVIASEDNEEFRAKLMCALSDYEFRVFAMYLEGMSYADICSATKRTQKSIDNAISRAKKKLQTAFGK